jgi:hypothetical protein
MSLAIWPLAAQNVSLYPLAPGGKNVLLIYSVPGGTNPINMRPLWGRFSKYPDPGGVTCFLLFGPWRHKMFHHTLWPLAALNVSSTTSPITMSLSYLILFHVL